jgi:hypothetical protein
VTKMPHTAAITSCFYSTTNTRSSPPCPRPSVCSVAASFFPNPRLGGCPESPQAVINPPQRFTQPFEAKNTLVGDDWRRFASTFYNQTGGVVICYWDFPASPREETKGS